MRNLEIFDWLNQSDRSPNKASLMNHACMRIRSSHIRYTYMNNDELTSDDGLKEELKAAICCAFR